MVTHVVVLVCSGVGQVVETEVALPVEVDCVCDPAVQFDVRRHLVLIIL